MTDIIKSANKDPLGAMMLDYFNGSRDAFLDVESTTLDMWTMTGENMFRQYPEMAVSEQFALELCEGRILDVGAGSGCHSLYLQKNHKETDALEISPGCVEVMARKKVKNIIHQNLFLLKKKKYKTILMLMNGLGICGSLDGCNLFLQFIKTILVRGGQVIAESTDLSSFFDDANFDFSAEIYYGETEFVMKYKNITSDPFDWLYIDFDTLEGLVNFNSLRCEKLHSDINGRYLVRIF